MSDEIPIKLVDLVTGDTVPQATYRYPQHTYNGGFADGCVFIFRGHDKYGDDKFHPSSFYVDKEKNVLVGRLTACGCNLTPCESCLAYYRREKTEWWVGDLSAIADTTMDLAERCTIQ